MAKRPPEQTPGRGDQPPSTDQEPAAPAPDQATSVDELASLLRNVVTAGIDHATPTTLRSLFGLSCVRDRARDTSEDELTAAARDVIRDALTALGDGKFGRAARLLFGATDDIRGQTARERRRLAAYQLDVLPDWFRRRYVPQIVTDVAAEILKIERADMPDTAEDDTGTGAAVVRTPDIAPTTDGDETPVSLASGPRALTPVATQPGQLQRVLQSLRDQQTRKEWHLVWLVGAVLVYVRWGLDAVPRYVLVLAVLALVKTATDMIRLWRATRSLPRGDQWPGLLLRLCVVIVAGGFIVGQDDDNRAPVAGDKDCLVISQNPDGSCPEPPSTTDPREIDSRHVPTTFADPGREVEPECPPETGSRERPLRFTQPPPLCIDPDKHYLATVATNYGDFKIVLNTQDALYTVNNFVFLARWGFYDGTVLRPAAGSTTESEQSYTPDDSLFSYPPVAKEDEDKVPGYRMTFEQQKNPYPEIVYVLAGDQEHPDRFRVVISPEGHEGVEKNGKQWPVLGVIGDGLDVISRDAFEPREDDLCLTVPDGCRAPSVTGSKAMADMVIESVTVDEQDTPPEPTTSTRPDYTVPENYPDCLLDDTC